MSLRIKSLASGGWCIESLGAAALRAFAITLSIGVTAAALTSLSVGRRSADSVSTAASVRLGHELVRLDPPIVTGTVVARSGRMIQTVDEEWARQLRDPSYWARQRAGSSGSSSTWSPSPSKPSKLGMGWPETLSPFGERGAQPSGRGWGQSTGTYRTVCVRLCDGYYWPISFSTSRSNFERDATRCEATCAGAKLYVYRNPGEEVDDMQDLRGQPYTKLATAFLYRTKYDASCKCHPHPWEEASRLRHRIYALEAASRRGDKVAGAELKTIRETARKSRSSRQSSKDDARGGQDASAVPLEGAAAEFSDLDANPALANALGEPVAVSVKAKKKHSSKTAATRSRAAQKTAPERIAKASPPVISGQVIMRLGAQPARVVSVRTERRYSGTSDWSAAIAGGR